MSTNSAQLGWAKETTAGTRVTPNKFAEFTGEGIQQDILRIDRMGMKPGRRLNQGWATGNRTLAGPTTFDMSAQTIGSALELAIGDVQTTGSDPYTHTFTPGKLESATVQIGTPAVDSTIFPRDYLGCFVNQWSIEAAIDQYVVLTLDWLAQEEQLNQTIATPSYTQTDWFTYVTGVISIAGSETCIDTATVTGNNNLDSHYCMKSTLPGHPTHREMGRREYGGTMTADFTNLNEYNRFLNGDEFTFSMVFTAAASRTLTIAGNVRYDGTTPNVSGPDEIVKQELPFIFTSGVDDATAFTATLVNNEATP